MKSRRIFLKNAWKTFLTITGIGALMGGIHKALQKHSMKYPVVRRTDRSKKLYGLQSQGPRLIRPPGALEEKKFLAGCIRCTRCQDACDVGAIRLFTESDGKIAHTPYIDPAIRACNLCMKCTSVCPSGVLQDLTVKDRAKANMGTVELKKELCLSHKAKRIRAEQGMLVDLGREATESIAPYERRGPCGECYMFCPLRGKAITLEPGAFLAPEIVTDVCVGCGMCEEICRTVVRGEPAIKVVSKRKII